MHWTLALQFARNQPDLTYEEWCGLYVDPQHPTPQAIAKACKVAHPILVRRRVIEKSVTFDQTIRDY